MKKILTALGVMAIMVLTSGQIAVAGPGGSVPEGKAYQESRKLEEKNPPSVIGVDEDLLKYLVKVMDLEDAVMYRKNGEDFLRDGKGEKALSCFKASLVIHEKYSMNSESAKDLLWCSQALDNLGRQKEAQEYIRKSARIQIQEKP
jgi:tetratricopeptide (TPR) repeat protein